MPGADAKAVQWNVTGADGITVDANGNLQIKTDLGTITNESPYVYQPVGNKHMIVEGRWQVQGNTVSFVLGQHDPRLPLIIDPLVYGTYLGSDAVPFFSSGQEEIHSGAADSKGNLFMTGWTDSVTFPVTDGPYGINTPVGFDMFLMRLEADAYSMDYAALIGGSGIDIGIRCRVQRSFWRSLAWRYVSFGGLCRRDERQCWRQPPGADQVHGRPERRREPELSASTTTLPVPAAFIAVGGDPSVPAFFPAATNAQAVFGDLLVASDGTAYLVGRASSANLAGFNGFHPQFVGGGTDGFVTRFDVAGNVVDETVIGSTGNDTIGQAALDSQNNFVVSGGVSCRERRHGCCGQPDVPDDCRCVRQWPSSSKR